MTTQPDPTIRERLRERHVEVGDRDGGGYRDPYRVCLDDGQTWPCDAHILAEYLDTLERRVRAAESILGRLGTGSIWIEPSGGENPRGTGSISTEQRFG